MTDEKIENTFGGILKDAKNYPKKIDQLSNLISTFKSRGDVPISKSTIANYTHKLNKLNLVVTGHNYDGDLEWINNPKNVIKILSSSSLSSKKDYLTAPIRLLKWSNSSNDTIAEYQKALAEFKATEDIGRKQNKASAVEKERAMPLSDIKRNILNFKPENEMELVQKLICSFYFLNDNFTPRNDLYEFKIVSNTKKINKMDPEFNYIVVNKKGESEGIIMNNYKTKRTYGRVKFDISQDLKKVLDEYLKSYGKLPGDFLFVMKDGRQFKEDNFRDLIKSSMEHVVGSPINIDLVRKIKITNYFAKKQHSIAEDEEFAKTFLHSTNIQREYIKVDLNYKQIEEDD